MFLSMVGMLNVTESDSCKVVFCLREHRLLVTVRSNEECMIRNSVVLPLLVSPTSRGIREFVGSAALNQYRSPKSHEASVGNWAMTLFILPTETCFLTARVFSSLNIYNFNDNYI